jgi:lysophospholipase L1-like esterase
MTHRAAASRLLAMPALMLALGACAPLPQAAPPPAAGPTRGDDAPTAAGAVPAPAFGVPGGGGGKATAAVHMAAPRRAAHWRETSQRGKAVASSGPAGAAVDGDRTTEWNPRTFVRDDAPEWLALPLDGPAGAELAISWHGHAMHYVNYDYGRPRTYEILTSADSTDGKDGTWKPAGRVTDNMVRSRVDLVRAPGARWVKLVFLTSWSGVDREPFLREVEVRERVDEGAVDAWLVMGDSTTSVGLDPAQPDAFSPVVAARWPEHAPILMSGGTGGDTSAEATARLAVALPTLPAGSVVGLCYGSNDAKRGVALEDYRRGLQAAVDQIRAAGHQPVIATLPWSLNGSVAAYARVCREVGEANDLPPGPDFHAHFKAHPDELAFDRVHPNEKGVAAMQRLWAEAGAFRYE